jgi:hypothetical protein
MAGAAVAIDRYALYYPYIHLRDANWSKATLLWFGQIRRIAPVGFVFKDLPDIAPLANAQGPNGYLIQSARLGDQKVADANRTLLELIQKNLPRLQAKFASEITPMKLRGKFEIYRRKFLVDSAGSDVVGTLSDSRLAWPSTRAVNPDDWVCVHPDLGSALMSYLALAIAGNEGLDIVTDKAELHEALIAEKEEDVFTKLLRLPDSKRADGSEDLTDNLGQLIVTTQFDVSMLDAKDIVELLGKKKDLRSFRKKVADAAGEIPQGTGSEERIERLKAKKNELIEEWKECSSFFPKPVRDTFAEVSAEETAKKIVEGLPELSAAVAAKTVTAHVLGGVPGLSIAILAGAGIKMWRKQNSPLKYLSRIDSAISKGIKSNTGSLYLPQWSKL